MASFPLVPGSTIGVLGGGQLGRMLALAAARLGFDVVILDPEENSPAGRVAARQIVASYDDRWALKRLAEACDVVTYEFENVPADTVAELASLGAIVSPGAKALAAAQDRVVEKSFLAEIGVPTVAFAAVHDGDSLAEALAKIGAPSLLKTRREGYDGKGQAWIQKAADASASLTAAKATVGTPISARKLFSTTRSWAAAKALAPGATTAPRAASSATVSAGTFSNS